MASDFFPVVECGGTFTDEEGSFQTPRYPKPYPANIECEWIITVPVTHSLTLTFDAFGVEESSKCKYDYVEIRDGATESSTLIGKFCAINLFSSRQCAQAFCQ